MVHRKVISLVTRNYMTCLSYLICCVLQGCVVASRNHFILSTNCVELVFSCWWVELCINARPRRNVMVEWNIKNHRVPKVSTKHLVGFFPCTIVTISIVLIFVPKLKCCTGNWVLPSCIDYYYYFPPSQVTPQFVYIQTLFCILFTPWAVWRKTQNENHTMHLHTQITWMIEQQCMLINLCLHWLSS